MSFDFSVEPITSEKGEGIVSLTKWCWVHDYAGLLDQGLLDAFPEEIFLEGRRFIQNQPGCSCLMAVTDSGVIAGFCDAGKMRGCNGEDEERTGEIYAIYIHPDYRKSGIGTCLFKSQVSFLKGNGFVRFVVWTLKGNQKARLFYEKMGGTLIRQEERMIFGRGYPSVMYVWD